MEIAWEWPERLLSWVALLLLAALAGITLWAWPRLPDVIPIHFGTDGRPDGWGERIVLLLLPVVGAGLYALLTGLARMPHLYNYPWPITPENAPRQYRLARRFILLLRVVVTTIFLYITVGAVSVAMGAAEGLGLWFLPSMLVVIGLSLVGYLVAGWRAR